MKTFSKRITTKFTKITNSKKNQNTKHLKNYTFKQATKYAGVPVTKPQQANIECKLFNWKVYSMSKIKIRKLNVHIISVINLFSETKLSNLNLICKSCLEEESGNETKDSI